MYETAFVHMAYDKAGSTALQATSAALQVQLQAAGVHYPQPIISNNHNRLASAFFADPRQANFNQSVGRSSWPEAQIRQQDREFLKTYEERIVSGRGTLFLSFEGFIWLSCHEHVRLRDWLLKFAPEIKVIVYVRDPLSYAESAISQQVRTGRPIKTGHHRHDLNIAKLVEVYGRENVIVREFGAASLEGGDVRHDCYSLLGLEQEQIEQLLAHEAVPASAANTALSMHAVGIGEALRLGLADTEFMTLPGAETRFFRVFGSVLSAVPGPGFSLSVSQEMYLFCRPGMRAASRYLLDEFGIDFRWRTRRWPVPSRLERFRQRKRFDLFRKHGAYASLANALIRQMASEIKHGTSRDFTDPTGSSGQTGKAT